MLSIFTTFFCHLPFLAGIVVVSTHNLGLTSMRATASYSYDKLVVAVMFAFNNHLILHISGSIVGFTSIKNRTKKRIANTQIAFKPKLFLHLILILFCEIRHLKCYSYSTSQRLNVLSQP